jgi:hypothetical protein
MTRSRSTTARSVLPIGLRSASERSSNAEAAATRRATVRRFIDLSGVVLEAHDSGVDVLRLIERRIGIERLREDRDRAQGIVRPAETGRIDLLITPRLQWRVEFLIDLPGGSRCPCQP